MTLKEARKSFPTNKVLAEAYRNLWPLMQRGVSESEYFILWRKEVGRLRDRNQRWSDRERAKHPERYRAFARASYHRHRQRRVEDARRVRQERKNDPERLLAHRIWCRNNVKRRKAIDPQYRIRFLMRNRIWMALDRGVAKAGSTVDLLGCTIPEFKRHIEALWLPGMTWDNYGKLVWHIDHIKPCKSFDLTDQAQQKLCFHYTNTRPLWAKDNLSKGAEFLNDVILPAERILQNQNLQLCQLFLRLC